MKTYGERLQYALNKCGISQIQLAEICDINRSNITNYIKNVYTPKSVLNEKIASALNVSPSWLFLGVGNEVANDMMQNILLYNGTNPIKKEIADIVNEILNKTDDPNTLELLKNVLDGFNK